MGGALTLPPSTPRIVKKLLYSLIDKAFDVGVVPELNRERAQLGLKTIEHLLPHLQDSADLYVTLFPEWFTATKPDYPKPLINGDFVLGTPSQEPISSELAEFLTAGQPPVIFTASTANVPVNKFFEIAADVVDKLNTRAIFVTSDRNNVPVNLPKSVLWQEYVPFNRVLPEASAIVHYGGIGTLAEACKAGVPQLILPFSYDQFDNASIVRDLGIGKSIFLRLVTKGSLLKQLSELLRSQDIRKNCTNVSANFRSGLATKQIVDRVLAAI